MLELLQSRRTQLALRGAFCAAVGVHIAGGFLFPLLSLAGIGSDFRHPLYVEIFAGMLGALWVSPIAAIIGAICAVTLGPTLTSSTRFALVLFGAAFATLPWMLLGGLEDLRSVWVLSVLGALATVIGLSLFSFRIPEHVA